MPEKVEEEKMPFKPAHVKTFATETEAKEFVNSFNQKKKEGEIPKWGRVKIVGKKAYFNVSVEKVA